MASLSDTIQQNAGKVLTRGPNGELAYSDPTSGTTTPAPLATLTANAGLPSSPTTPGGAAAIGATPDQAKMAGTPAQLSTALNQSVGGAGPVAQGAPAPGKSLQDTLREQQTSSSTTAAQQSSQQKSANLQSLGGLGDRVSTFMAGQRSALESAAGAGVAQGVSTTATDPVTGQALTADQANAIKAWQANPSSQDAVLAVNTALGYDVSKQLDPAQVGNLFQSATDALAAGGQAAVASSLTVSDLLKDPKFGYDLPTLSGLLGIPAAQLSTMTPQQLSAQVDKVTADEFSTTQQQAALASGGELGAAQQGVLQQAGKEASASGVRASEAQMGALEQQVAQGDEVQFNGKSVPVEDLLSNQGISSTISDALNAGPGSPQMQSIQQNEPALYDFIQKNQAVLTQAAQQLSGAAGQFRDTQSSTKAAQDATGLSSEALQALDPNYGKLRTTAFDPNSLPLTKAMAGMGDTEKQSTATNINSMITALPKGVGASLLTQMTPDLVTGLGMNQSPPGPGWNAVLNKISSASTLGNLTKPDDIYNAATGGTGGVAGAQATAQKNQSYNVLFSKGSPVDSPVMNPDGSLKDPAAVKAALLATAGVPTLQDLKDAAAGKPIGYQPPPAATPVADPPAGSVEASLVSKLGPAASSGKVTAQDIAGANLSGDEMLSLMKSGGPGVDKGYLGQAIQDERGKRTQKAMADVEKSGMRPVDKIHAIEQAYNSDPTWMDLGQITQYTDMLAGGQAKYNAQAAASKARGGQAPGAGLVSEGARNVRDVLTGKKKLW